MAKEYVFFTNFPTKAAEQKYSQIEKTGLALIFVLTTFHKIIFGRKFFNLQTDHRLLFAIFGSKKGIPVYTANRLQRWALTLLTYDFEIEYISTISFEQMFYPVTETYRDIY